MTTEEELENAMEAQYQEFIINPLKSAQNRCRELGIFLKDWWGYQNSADAQRELIKIREDIAKTLKNLGVRYE